MSLATLNVVAGVAPNSTAVAFVNPVPLSVMRVPPATAPWLGAAVTSDGRGALTSTAARTGLSVTELPTGAVVPARYATPPTETVLVIGDQNADWLAYGLEEALAARFEHEPIEYAAAAHRSNFP